MKTYCNLFKLLVLLAALVILLPSHVSAGWWNSGAQCDDIYDSVDGGHLNVLTFNILFFAPEISVALALSNARTNQITAMQKIFF